jgi:hypothetical protein
MKYDDTQDRPFHHSKFQTYKKENSNALLFVPPRPS